MFKPVAMRKVYVLGLADQVEQTTSALAASALVHLDKVTELPEFAKAFTQVKNEDLERRYRLVEEQYRACLVALGMTVTPYVEASDLSSDLGKEAAQLAAMVSEVHDACEKQVGRRKDLLEEEKHLLHIRNLMELLGGLEADLGAFERMRFMKITLGMVGHEKLALLREGLRDRFIVVDRKVRAGEHLVMIVGDREDQPLLEKVLAGALFQELLIPPEFLGNPKDVGKKIQARVREIAAEKKKIEEGLAALRTRYHCALQTLGNKIQCADLHFFARGHFKNSKETLILTGWLPAEKVAELRRGLAGRNNHSEVMIVEDTTAVSALAKAPTLLRHGWLIRPFENILKIYGLPNYRELDPTLYTTVGFMLMFGMMFGDVGHGLFLASVGAWLKWSGKTKKKPMLKDVGFLFLACGTVSAIFGFLYGSVFGFENLIHSLWFSPFEQLHYGLIVAIAWGVAFILGGAILNIVNRVTNGQYIEALFGRTGVAGIWFYLGSVALVAGLLGEIAPLKTIGALLALCLLPIALIGLKEPLEAWKHNGHAKSSALEIFILSVMEIYDTILSYLSNTLSFMRVAAFALNHVALLLAVFAIAHIVKDSSGSGILYWAMIAGGNLAVIGLEGMIVTIQTLRLIYYEGFSKFFSGDGVAYEPFTVTTAIK